MGNARSFPEVQEEDIWWRNPSVSEENAMQTDDRRRAKEELDEFKLELARKHERRRQLIAEKHKELQELRDEVKHLREENEELKRAKEGKTTEVIEDIRRSNLELKMTIASLQKDLQELNGEVAGFEKERQDYKAHVVALKDVINVSKQMLLIREAQLKELKEKVKEIEISLAGKELKVLSQDLRAEYEKQLQKIKNLRVFYEERQRADNKEKEEMRKFLDELKKELAMEKDKNKELQESLEKSEEENSKKYDEIMSLESTLGLTRAECRQYQAELSVINQLFAQILLGFQNNQEVDIDKLVKLLEENHHLLQDIAINEESNQVSALPKVLLDLVNEVNKEPEEASSDEDNVENKETTDLPNSHQLNSVPEIVENLPKVWKVLIELLSHQCAPAPSGEKNEENPCYKVVETPKGSHLVLSVSRTFIRLKDLILEKKSLERETGRLKHLNTHLEGRLQEQERRLDMVTKELSETWHVVGKLQKKHQLLHTQEKILRYELAQKRKLLTELKSELEYSREKWLEAREKNSNSQKQWEQLRIEFASRKSAPNDDYNNSVESGYSDDKECSSEDEPGYESDVFEAKQKVEVPENEEKIVDAVLDNSEQKMTVDEVPSGVEQKIVEEAPSGVEQKTVEEVPSGVEQKTIEEVPSGVEQRIVEEVPSGVEQRIVEEVPSGVEQKTVEEVPRSVEQRIVEEVPNGVEQKTVEEVPRSVEQRIVEEVPSGVEQKTVEEVPSGVEQKTVEEVPRSVEQRIVEEVPSRVEQRIVEEVPGGVEQKTVDETLSVREQRLLKLEGMCEGLVRQVTETVNRSDAISNKLDVLHETYGEESGDSSEK